MEGDTPSRWRIRATGPDDSYKTYSTLLAPPHSVEVQAEVHLPVVTISLSGELADRGGAEEPKDVQVTGRSALDALFQIGLGICSSWLHPQQS